VTPPLVVIAGATATGKTALAIALAQRFPEGAEVVSADSVQIYRGLDIGSAKPTEAERAGVVHHLLDVADPTDAFDAARYRDLADQAIADITARGKVALVVGGTGLYLRALVYGLAEGIPADPALRATLHARIDAGGPAALAQMHAELALVDPVYAAKIHPTDPIRIVRALEVFALSGVPLSEHHRRHQALPPRHRAMFFGLEVPREVLRPRVRARVGAMLAQGLVAEVEGLLARGVPADAKPLRSVGYAEVVAVLRGEAPRAGLGEAMETATMAFAKRQRTWFRGEQGVRWLSPEALGSEPVWAEILHFVRNAPEGDGLSPASSPSSAA
jgi:tRNA dimethylallyltransferase